MGKPAYLWALASNPSHRREILRDGWKDVAKVFVAAALVDLIYQWIAMEWVYLGEAVLVAFVLASVPYVLIRASLIAWRRSGCVAENECNQQAIPAAVSAMTAMTGIALRATVWAGMWVLVPATAHAHANLQLWGNVTVDWVKSQRLVYEFDIEPKVLLDAPEGEPGWRNLDLTANVEYSPKGWMDLVAETTIGVTKQTDDIDSLEVTPRIGVRFHVFARTQRFHPRESAQRRRFVLRDLVRLESRNIFYGGAGNETSSTVRLRTAWNCSCR